MALQPGFSRFRLSAAGLNPRASGAPIIVIENNVQLQIEKLPEGYYLATSEDIPGLVAQGRTIAETVEIARDVARILLEARLEREG